MKEKLLRLPVLGVRLVSWIPLEADIVKKFELLIEQDVKDFGANVATEKPIAEPAG